MTKKAPGKTMLKVCGILLIIMAAFSLVSIVVSIFSYNMMGDPNSEFVVMMEQTSAQMGIEMPEASSYIQAAILGGIQFILFLIAGIVGVRFSNRVEKAGICLIAIVLVLALILGTAVYNTMFGGFSVLGTALNLVVPLIYFWGAMRNRGAVNLSSGQGA